MDFDIDQERKRYDGNTSHKVDIVKYKQFWFKLVWPSTRYSNKHQNKNTVPNYEFIDH